MIDPLFVDLYELDPPVDWAQYIAAGPPWHGAVFKLTQGTYYRNPTWASAQRDLFVSSPRYGVDLFDGFYHFLDLGQDGSAQADYFWDAMTEAGGEKIGTLWGMVDVERGGQHATPSLKLIEDCTSAFAARYEELSGRKPTLYGGELLRSFGVTSLLGCGRSSIARYTPTLPADVITSTGTDYDHLLFWQYCGDGEAYLAGYPKTPPGGTKIDISAMILPGGLDAMRAALWPESPDQS